MAPLHWGQSRWKETPFDSVARYIRTGMATIPKRITPFHIDRMNALYKSARDCQSESGLARLDRRGHGGSGGLAGTVRGDPGQRQPQLEPAVAAATGGDVAAVRLDQAAGDRQPQAG